MTRLLLAALAALVLALGAAPVIAAEPIVLVHQEQVQAEPYTLTVGFSRWPLRAERSLDFLFLPEGGIDGLSGTLTFIDPSGQEFSTPLSRHPRQRSAWGLDVFAVPWEGPWTVVFTIDGPQGQGVGRLPLMVGERPGPPAALAWGLGLIPVVALLGLVAVAWARVRPGRQPDAWSW
jgi:hypothetical protein